MASRGHLIHIDQEGAHGGSASFSGYFGVRSSSVSCGDLENGLRHFTVLESSFFRRSLEKFQADPHHT